MDGMVYHWQAGTCYDQCIHVTKISKAVQNTKMGWLGSLSVTIRYNVYDFLFNFK